MRHTLALAGWLLVGYYGGAIAWYETEADCRVALQSIDPRMPMYDCAPDRFAVEEMRQNGALKQ